MLWDCVEGFSGAKGKAQGCVGTRLNWSNIHMYVLLRSPSCAMYYIYVYRMYG